MRCEWMSFVCRISSFCGVPGGGPPSPPASGLLPPLSLQAAAWTAAATASSGSHLPWRNLVRPRPLHLVSSMSEDLSVEVVRLRAQNVTPRDCLPSAREEKSREVIPGRSYWASSYARDDGALKNLNDSAGSFLGGYPCSVSNP